MPLEAKVPHARSLPGTTSTAISSNMNSTSSKEPSNRSWKGRRSAPSGSAVMGSNTKGNQSSRDKHHSKKKPNNRYNSHDLQWKNQHTGCAAPDKESYINVACRLVLDSRKGDVIVWGFPDTYMPMDSVLRVLTQPTRCPICLEDVPIAPRMLECGHIMCAPCLYQFFSVEDEGSDHPNWKYCPLCSDRARIQYVKPVTFTSDERYDTPHAGDEVVLRLMFRPKERILAVPANSDTVCRETFVKVPSVYSDIFEYSRFNLGGCDYAVKEFTREINELTAAMNELGPGYEDSKYWYKEAISLIGSAIDAELENNPKDPFLNVVMPLLENMYIGLRGEEFISQFNDSDAFFFYQTGFDSVTKYFLSPLDVRILKRTYGSFSNFPSLQIVRVEHVEYGSYTDDDIRKRIKYLCHLPKHTPLGFLECDWKGIVPDNVLKSFSKELNARKHQRRLKEQRELKEHERYLKEEKKILQRELLEEGIPIYNDDSPKGPIDLSLDPALPSTPSTAHAITPEPVILPAKSFAAVASTDPEQEELKQKISDAKKKGKKKVVLLSNGGQM